jgi:hypothetical protein
MKKVSMKTTGSFYVLMNPEETKFLGDGYWWVDDFKYCKLFYTLQGARNSRTRFVNYIISNLDESGNVLPWVINGGHETKIVEVIIPHVYINPVDN